MEPITVTRDEIIYHRRVRVLEHAGETGNVSLTCRTFGISRTRSLTGQMNAVAAQLVDVIVGEALPRGGHRRLRIVPAQQRR